MSNSENHRYDFEQELGSIRTTERAQNAAKKFLHRVKCKFEFKDLPAEDKVLILEYMIASVLNIDWYKDRIELEKKKQWRYVFISFGLLLLLPILLVGLSYVDLQPKNSSFDFGGMLVAILSSIIAFHKAFSEWFKNRVRKGEFWRAYSKIKENLYKLEGEYDGLKCENTTSGGTNRVLTDGFKKAVNEATAQCRKIANDEQQAFFDQEMLPSINLTKLTSSKTDATSLVSAFRSDLALTREESVKAQRKEAKDLAATEKALASAHSAYDKLNGLVSEISDKLISSSEQEKPDLEARLKTVKSEREKVYANLLANEIKLAMLRA